MPIGSGQPQIFEVLEIVNGVGYTSEVTAFTAAEAVSKAALHAPGARGGPNVVRTARVKTPA